MVSRGRHLALSGSVACVALLAAAGAARAQSGAADIVRRGAAHGGARPPAGFYEFVASHPGAFSFSHGWLAKARAVRERRQALRSRGAWTQLNAAPSGVPMASATAVGGTLSYPTFVAFFSNSSPGDTAILDSATVEQQFWGAGQAPPYSVTTYYQEVSSGRLTVTGRMIRHGIWLSQTDTFYAGGAGCQGICGTSRVPTLIYELLKHADSTINFAQFADSATGQVPAIVILDDQVGGECYQLYPPAANSIWAHRFSLSGWGVNPYQTNDSVNGHPVVVDDYIIQGGQGGSAGCSPGALAPIGTITHETGHLFGLPDLYDTSDQTEGIGRWDLMSEGNERMPWRPAHMSAWTLATLGWIAEVPVTAAASITTGPIETSDTAWIVPAGATPHNEYFLIENRQPLGSDSALYSPGLLVYHTDTVLIGQRLASNAVNALIPHGLWIVEADGLTNSTLFCSFGQACWSRGDAGDPFPGSTGNVLLTFGTNPSATKNSGAAAPVTIDSIRQLPNYVMRFRVTFGFRLQYAASGVGLVTASRVVVPGGTLLAEGDTLTLTASRGPGQSFIGWSGDSTASGAVLKLTMTRPFSEVANFAPTDSVISQLLTGAGAITPAVLSLLDQVGNRNGRFDLGDFVAWLDRNPGLVSADVVAKLLRSIRR